MDRDGLVTVPEAAPRGRAPAHGWGRNSFRALRSHPFRLYFSGQVISASGTLLQQTAIGWLVLRLTGSASSLGLVLAAGGLPSLILGPWGGSIADRVDLRKLLLSRSQSSVSSQSPCGFSLPRDRPASESSLRST